MPRGSQRFSQRAALFVEELRVALLARLQAQQIGGNKRFHGLGNGLEAGPFEEALAHVLARQLRAPFVNLKTFPLKTELVRLLPETPARRFRALVLEERGEQAAVVGGCEAEAVPLDDLAQCADGVGLSGPERREVGGLEDALEPEGGGAIGGCQLGGEDDDEPPATFKVLQLRGGAVYRITVKFGEQEQVMDRFGHGEGLGSGVAARPGVRISAGR